MQSRVWRLQSSQVHLVNGNEDYFKCQLSVNFNMLQRMAGDHFDKDGSALVRIQSDGPPKTASPHILAVRIGK